MREKVAVGGMAARAGGTSAQADWFRTGFGARHIKIMGTFECENNEIMSHCCSAKARKGSARTSKAPSESEKRHPLPLCHSVPSVVNHSASQYSTTTNCLPSTSNWLTGFALFARLQLLSSTR